MRCLIVEDEFTSRRILHRILAEFGECDVAVDGEEAQEAFSLALQTNEPYDVIFLDIMLPSVQGQDVLKSIRDQEDALGVELGRGARVIMTTSLKDAGNVMKAFRSGCESYLVKPIEKEKVVSELRKLGVLKAA